MVPDLERARILIQNQFYQKWIAARLRAKGAKQQQGKRAQVPGLVEYLVDVGSEASITTSLHSGEEGSDPSQEVVASPHPDEMGTEPAQEVVASPHPGEVGREPVSKVVATADIEEEEEDENRDTHFKRKASRLL